MISVRQISAEDTYSLRNQVLRPGLPIETCKFDCDSISIHFGAFFGALESQAAAQPVGVITAHPDQNREFPFKNQYRIRGMAVAPERQGLGIGKALVERLLAELRSRGIGFVWCNAREIAIPFYERLGFGISGGFFEIPGVGPHKVMYRQIG